LEAATDLTEATEAKDMETTLAAEACETEAAEAREMETAARDWEAARDLDEALAARDTEATDSTEACETEATEMRDALETDETEALDLETESLEAERTDETEALDLEATELAEALEEEAAAFLASETIHWQAAETRFMVRPEMGEEEWVEVEIQLVQKATGLLSPLRTRAKSLSIQTAALAVRSSVGMAWTRAAPKAMTGRMVEKCMVAKVVVEVVIKRRDV
jgi:hypothetical protein